MKLLLIFCWVLIGVQGGMDDLWEASCPLKKTPCMCQPVGENSALCCHISVAFELNESLNCQTMNKKNIAHFLMRNITLETLNANLMWSSMQTLTITESKVHNITNQFHGQLAFVNISSIGLTDIDLKAFKNLKNLHTLILSKNNLTNVPDISPSETLTTNFTLDISENRFLWCHSVIDLMDNFHNSSQSLNFLNENDTECLSSRSFNWFNSTDKVHLEQVIMLKKLELKCPRGPNYKCHCSPYRVDFLPGQVTYNAKVDCSDQQLTKLPLHLPPNTRLLNVTNNNITSLDILSVESSYRDITEFYADNNQIDSIAVLEGSYFIDHFAMLSLRGNNLTSIPTYILSNAFDRNRRVHNIKLGGNRLNCVCNTLQVLKVWLMTNKAYLPDYEEVLCAGLAEKVIFVDLNRVCDYEKEWADYIYYIIGAEIILLVCIISKLIYDCYIFKRYGYLPWPASKMPKLPCERIFE